jgi:cysteine desulfurase
LAERELPGRTDHLTELRERLGHFLRERISDLVVHGGAVPRLPNTLCVALPGTVAVDVATRADGVATSAGAACHSGRPHVSATLRAMGVPDDLALATIRLSVGRPTSLADVELAAARIADAAIGQREARR